MTQCNECFICQCTIHANQQHHLPSTDRFIVRVLADSVDMSLVDDASSSLPAAAPSSAVGATVVDALRWCLYSANAAYFDCNMS